MKGLSITYSLAEQCFKRSRSIGHFKFSVGLARFLSRRPEIERFTLFSNDTITGLDLPNIVKIEIHNEANSRGLRRIIWDQFGVYSAAARSGNNWLFMPKGFVSFLRKCPVNLATFVPDAMLDFYERTYPEHYNRFECKYLKLMLRATLSQSKVVFTNSKFISGELTALSRRWGIEPPPFVEIGAGYEPRQKYQGEKQNRVMMLVSTWKHKRTDLAMEYLKRWAQGKDYEIAIFGSLPKGISLPSGKWHLYNRIPEDEYRKMMERSRALIYFSEYEGFGAPPVEAILGGVCPVYSDIPASREVVMGFGAPFDNNSYESFAKALDYALTVSAEQIDNWGKILFEKYNFKKEAETIANAMIKAQQSG